MQDVFDTDSDLEIPTASYRSMRQRDARSAGTRRLLIISGVLGLGLVGVGGAWEYANHQSRQIPVIEADGRPMRVKPENPGGMQVAGAGESILSGNGGGTETLAPPPEAPDPGGLRAQEQAVRAREAAAPMPTVIPGLSRQGVAASDVPLPPGSDATEAPMTVPAPQAAPVARPQGRQAVATPNPQPPAIIAQRATPTPVAAAAPVPARPAAPAMAPTPAPVAAAVIPALSGQPAATAGGRHVQLAAVDSEAGAAAEWERLSRRMPELLSGRHPEVIRVERDGHVFYRLRTSGFADAATASTFCNEVKAKGGHCAPAGL